MSTNCFKCKIDYKDNIKLSCNHNICQKCLCKTLLKKHLMEIPDKDVILIQCKCKTRQTELSLTKISDFLKIKGEQIIVKCQKHSEQATNPCKECTIYLCDQCLSSHNDLFTNHSLTSITNSNKKNIIAIQPVEKCKEHNKEFTSYCKSCKCCLCQFCSNDE